MKPHALAMLFVLLCAANWLNGQASSVATNIKYDIIRQDVILEWQIQDPAIDKVVIEHSSNGVYFQALKTVSGLNWQSIDHENALREEPRRLYRLHFYDQSEEYLGGSRTIIVEPDWVFDDPVALIEYADITRRPSLDPDVQ
ncbi:MAG: hypothetical protein AAF598_10875 [Bacteroidota bacterium]